MVQDVEWSVLASPCPIGSDELEEQPFEDEPDRAEEDSDSDVETGLEPWGALGLSAAKRGSEDDEDAEDDEESEEEFDDEEEDADDDFDDDFDDDEGDDDDLDEDLDDEEEDS